MGMRGAIKKSSALNKLHGNPSQKKPKKPKKCPVVITKEPKAPNHLSRIAAAEWRRSAKFWIKAGKLTSTNIKGFEAYCINYSDLRKAEADKKKHGLVVRSKSGHPMPNPAIAVSNKAQALMLSWMRLLDTTEGEPLQDVDPMDEFLKSGGKPRRVK